MLSSIQCEAAGRAFTHSDSVLQHYNNHNIYNNHNSNNYNHHGRHNYIYPPNASYPSSTTMKRAKVNQGAAPSQGQGKGPMVMLPSDAIVICGPMQGIQSFESYRSKSRSRSNSNPTNSNTSAITAALSMGAIVTPGLSRDLQKYNLFIFKHVLIHLMSLDSRLIE